MKTLPLVSESRRDTSPGFKQDVEWYGGYQIHRLTDGREVCLLSYTDWKLQAVYEFMTGPDGDVDVAVGVWNALNEDLYQVTVQFWYKKIIYAATSYKTDRATHGIEIPKGDYLFRKYYPGIYTFVRVADLDAGLMAAELFAQRIGDSEDIKSWLNALKG